MPVVDLVFPFKGSWLTQNSPANVVPSHGTTQLASSFAIDFVPVDQAGRTAPLRLGSLLRPEPAGRFPGFGRAILAPVCGVVVAAHGAEPDHRAVRGLPSVGYALLQGRRVGEELGRCGNSGNSTEPHVRVQAMDRADPLHASPLPITFGGHPPRNGDIIDAG